MNNRELAIVILVTLTIGVALVMSDVRQSAVAVVRALVNPKILIPLLLFLCFIGVAVLLASQAGLWGPELTGATLFWFVGVGLSWMMSIGESGKPGFITNRFKELIGVGAFVAFALNLYVFNLLGELILQSALGFLGLLYAVAQTNLEYKKVAKALGLILGAVTLALIWYTIDQLRENWQTLDPARIRNELLLPFWLTAVGLAFMYPFALIASYESLFIRMRFWNEKCLPHPRAVVGIVAGLKGSLRNIADFRPPEAQIAARARTFSEARQAVSASRERRNAESAEKVAARNRLVDNAGAIGTDADGRRLDRRDFAETKEALEWIAMCQMGWYRNSERPNTYRTDLIEMLHDFTTRGLPAEHGIEMKVRADGQAWYAYRRTPCGYYFAIGAKGAPPSQWFYDGVTAPASFPTEEAQGWSSSLDPTRLEWRKEART